MASWDILKIAETIWLLAVAEGADVDDPKFHPARTIFFNVLCSELKIKQNKVIRKKSRFFLFSAWRNNKEGIKDLVEQQIASNNFDQSLSNCKAISPQKCDSVQCHNSTEMSPLNCDSVQSPPHCTKISLENCDAFSTNKCAKISSEHKILMRPKLETNFHNDVGFICLDVRDVCEEENVSTELMHAHLRRVSPKINLKINCGLKFISQQKRKKSRLPQSFVDYAECKHNSCKA